MRNGLYKVAFNTQLGTGYGVIHAVDGRIWGGDAGLYYVGTYSAHHDQLAAKVQIDRHTNAPGVHSVLGVDRAEINLQGKVNGDMISAAGTSPQAQNVKFDCTLTRIAD